MPEKTEQDIIYSLETAAALLEKCVRALELQGGFLEKDDAGCFAELAACMGSYAKDAVSLHRTAASLMNDIGKAHCSPVFLSQVKNLEERIGKHSADFSSVYSQVKAAASSKMGKYREKISSLSEIPAINRTGTLSASFLHSPEVIDISV